MKKGYKYRIYPTPEQAAFIQKCCAASRVIYNFALGDSKRRREEDKKNGVEKPYYYSRYEYSKIVRDMIKNATNEDGTLKYGWIKECDSMLINYALIDLDMAYANIKKTGAGFPQFKRAGKCNRSYSFQKNKSSLIIVDDKYITVPKAGLVKIKLHRPIPEFAIMTAATISITPTDEYYISISLTLPDTILENEGGQVGIDVGIKSFYCDSNGHVVDNPKFMKKSRKKLQREQRKLTRKLNSHIIGYRRKCDPETKYQEKQDAAHNIPVYDKPLSECRNYQKQRRKVAKIHQHVARQRDYFQDVESRKLAKENSLICMEDLRIQNMQKNHKLAGNVSDAAWFSFKSKVDYKVKEHGGVLVSVPTFYPSSQTCFVCGYQNRDVKNLKIRKWTCPECGTEHDRDINAGKNILAKGQEILAGA